MGNNNIAFVDGTNRSKKTLTAEILELLQTRREILKENKITTVYKGLTTKKNDSREFNEAWVEGDLIHSGGKLYIHPIGNLVRVENDLGKIIIMHEVQPETVTLISK